MTDRQISSTPNLGALAAPTEMLERDGAEEKFLRLVDPELQVAASALHQLYAQYMPMTIERLLLRRAALNKQTPEPELNSQVQRRHIPSAAGEPDVPVYILNAKPGSRPGILYIHGGGFIASSAAALIPTLKILTQALDCTAVAVEYRLAPETRYEGSIADNYAALLWMFHYAEDLGLDRSRIAVAGDSAGAGHAALLTILARDRRQVSICFQCLTYPMLDDRTGSSRNLPFHYGAFGWSVDSNRFGWESFLGIAPGGDDVPDVAVPARIDDLSGLPPAFIGVGALDLFFEESLEYARRLAASTVPVELLVVPGAFHGFQTMVPEADVSRRFVQARTEALRRAFR